VVVANYRPQFSLDVPGARQLQLSELSPRQTGELLSSLLDGQAPPTEFVDFIVARTDGNPFFVEEIVNSLVETETLQRNDNGWEVVGDLGQIELPTSIRGVIAARIDRLDDRRRRVLREASVVGRDFLYDIVRRVSTETDDLMPSLDALEAADLIREKAIDPDLEYLFKHALTQDVAYDGLLKTEREELHARAAVAIEEQFGDRLEEVTETLAFHWSHSGNSDKAVPALVAAGRKAMERFALQESRAHYQRAYELLKAKPTSEHRDRSLVELLLEWAVLAYYEARLYDLRKLFVEHQEAVDRVGTAEQRGMWISWIGHAYLAADGEMRKAAEILDEALDIGRKADNVRVVGHAQSWRTYALWWLGRIDEALEAGKAAIALSARLPRDPYVWFKSQLGIGLISAVRGDFEEAQRIGNELIEFGRRTGSARSESMGHIVFCNLYSTLDSTIALAEARTAVEIASDPIYEHSPMPPVLFALLLSGDTQEARRYHDEQYQRFVVDLHVRMLTGWLEITDALIKMQEGRPLEGFDQLQKVVEEAEESGELTISHYARTFTAISYAEVAMSDVSLGETLRNARFAFRYGLKAKKEAYAKLDDVLEHLDDWELGNSRMLVESAYARLLAHDGDKKGAARHLQAGIDAIEPAGDTAMLREARELMAELTG